MPETRFRVRWPDGEVEACYSPSSVIRDYFEPGRAYALADFLDRCRDGLTAASERVARRYGGTGCSLARAQLAAIERKVTGLAAGLERRDDRGDDIQASDIQASEALVRFEGFDA